MITRRDFLKLAALSTGVLAFRPFAKFALPTFPEGERLGRIAVGKMDVFTTPDGSGQPIGAVYEDNLIVWIREVVGSIPGRTNQRFVETPNGYVWGGYIQPVRNQPNPPLINLATTSLGPGMWAEVTVPYVALVLDNPPARTSAAICCLHQPAGTFLLQPGGLGRSNSRRRIWTGLVSTE
jgi:hypothetical protein